LASQKENFNHSLLNGQVKIYQPDHLYRISIDPVLLGSVFPSDITGDVLDIGFGTGGVSLVMMHRCPELTFVGLEKQTDLILQASHNISLNSQEDRFELVEGDLFDMPSLVKNRSFDYVVTNPPFYQGEQAEKHFKKTAHSEQFDLSDWITESVKRVKARGYFAIIHQAERLDDILATLSQLQMGGVEVYPIYSKVGQVANRVIVVARKGVKTATTVYPPLYMHDDGMTDTRKYSDQAECVLRDGCYLKDVVLKS